MMKKDPEIFNDDLELENILKPQADFHVSHGFKQKVLEETKAIPRCRHRRWIPFIAAAAAAAVAVLVILTVMHSHDWNTPMEKPAIIASVERSRLTPTDTLKNEIQSPLIAEATQPLQQNIPIRKSSSGKRPKSKVNVSTESVIREEQEGISPQPVTEGEMPMITESRESSPDPEEVRKRLIESRRNAEIAYIERMRAEIEANDAYISQFVTNENIINSNTQIDTPF